MTADVEVIRNLKTLPAEIYSLKFFSRTSLGEPFELPGKSTNSKIPCDFRW